MKYRYCCSSNCGARFFSCLVQEKCSLFGSEEPPKRSNTMKIFPIDEAVFCGLVQGHSGILSFFVFVPVSETVHELITGTRVQFPPLGIYGFFSIAHYYLKQSKSKESGNKDN